MCQCPALYGCGALYRLFQFRSFHNLQADIRNQLHTFFFITLDYRYFLPENLHVIIQISKFYNYSVVINYQQLTNNK